MRVHSVLLDGDVSAAAVVEHPFALTFILNKIVVLEPFRKGHTLDRVSLVLQKARKSYASA